MVTYQSYKSTKLVFPKPLKIFAIFCYVLKNAAKLNKYIYVKSFKCLISMSSFILKAFKTFM